MYGYNIKNGFAVINEQEAEVIKKIFEGYISGNGLQLSAQIAGCPMTHSRVKRIIRNACYTGNDYYPEIISKQVYTDANAELIRRAKKHSCGKRLKPPPFFKDFIMAVPTKQYDDPFKQAEYLYSLIEVKI